ncbi:hypothetical protein M0805_001763 [Coniferiporia weirii]|nr:hypothetical protein M0805_001763 [Coniferiporia weirii]
MLRAATRSSLRLLHAHACGRRTLVSTVLLSKTYEDKTVAELRAELRNRGLSTTGSKATLITRIVQEEKRASTEVAPTPTLTRTVSTSSPSRAEPVASPTPTPNASAAAGTAPSSSAHLPFPAVKLPDISQGPLETPIAIPFLPDFWDSSVVKAQERSTLPSPDPDAPKIVLVAGAATHPAGGPTHNLSSAGDVLPSLSSSASPSPPRKFDGILGDILDDLNIPPEVFSPSSTAADEGLVSAKGRTQSRPLDADEKRGVYVILGLFLGSWAVSRVSAPSQGESD